ncbi:hypothetical protein RHSIM_Rhsim01G0146000 [Rhododendron simsii]|uniref:Glycosyl-hydrolase family 116 N-terminal domain-containing protein n=1 Tax=Rhododendron simsii TaxID=118357 RepID=A0A834HFP1_RHOSS|nr:hypothetical protein RHSIM_Rhsim01G0146000 [Rhododendron simsii]
MGWFEKENTVELCGDEMYFEASRLLSMPNNVSFEKKCRNGYSEAADCGIFLVLSYYRKSDDQGISSWEWNLSGQHSTYCALFPRAWTIYDGEPDPELEVSCRLLSPFIPHNYRESSLPIAVYVYTVCKFSFLASMAVVPIYFVINTFRGFRFLYFLTLHNTTSRLGIPSNRTEWIDAPDGVGDSRPDLLTDVGHSSLLTRDERWSAVRISSRIVGYSSSLTGDERWSAVRISSRTITEGKVLNQTHRWNLNCLKKERRRGMGKIIKWKACCAGEQYLENRKAESGIKRFEKVGKAVGGATRFSGSNLLAKGGVGSQMGRFKVDTTSLLFCREGRGAYYCRRRSWSRNGAKENIVCCHGSTATSNVFGALAFGLTQYSSLYEISSHRGGGIWTSFAAHHFSDPLVLVIGKKGRRGNANGEEMLWADTRMRDEESYLWLANPELINDDA